jgi:hypothetical protein
MWVLLFLQMTTQGLMIETLVKFSTYDECISEVVEYTPALQTNTQILACVYEEAEEAI